MGMGAWLLMNDTAPAAKAAPAPAGYQVADLTVDLTRRRVRRGDSELLSAGLSFDLFLVLLEAAPDLASVNELMHRVWPGLIVSPESVSQRVKIIRRALGDEADQPRYIAGERGRGYRLIAPVTALAATGHPEPSLSAPATATQAAASRARVPDPDSGARRWRRWWPISAAVIVLAVVAGILATQLPNMLSRGAAQAERPSVVVQPARTSVAVLPFVNLTGDPGKDYFSDGMAEEMIDALAQVPGLRVSARTSSFAYKGSNVDARQISRDLGVDTLLEGSVRSAGERIRITAQLIDARSGYQLWSQSYDRHFVDVFKLEDDLAVAIVAAFRQRVDPAVAVAPVRVPPTEDVEAYRMFLQAQEAADSDSQQSWLAAVALYDSALERDPRFARALAGRALARVSLNDVGYPLSHAFEDAERDAREALALSPHLASAHSALGVMDAEHGDWSQAEKDFEAAIEADPADATIRTWHAVRVLFATGQLRRALAEATEGIRLAPADGFPKAMRMMIDQARGDDGSSVRRTDPSLGDAAHGLETAIDVARQGRYADAADRAIDALSPAARAAGGADAMRQAYRALADPALNPAARQTLEAFATRIGTRDVIADRILMLFTMLGAVDLAYHYAYRTLDDASFAGTVGNRFTIWYPEMRPFRRDPRFAAYVARLKLPDYWKRYGPPDGCELKADEITCR